MRHQPSLRLLALLLIIMFALPRAASADYPVGDPPETVQFDHPGTVIDYEVRVVNVDFDAGDLLRAYAPSTPITAGNVAVMIQVEATYTGDRVGHPGDDMSYSVSDIGGGHHDLLNHACPAWPFAPDDLALNPGQTGRFNLCFQVPIERMSTQWIIATDGTEITAEPEEIARLTVSTNLITDQWPVSFSLDASKSTIDPEVPDCGCALSSIEATG